jgi:hypothetical protein
MDVTTVNDRHLYEGRILVRDPGSPVGQRELSSRIIRFGPTGWITVVDDLTADAEVVLYPTSQVLSVSALREVGGGAISASANR